MPSALNIIGQSQPPGAEQILYAEIAAPTPDGFDDPLYVIFPDWSNQYSFKLVGWDAVNGATLPALGAQALVIKDNRGLLRCVWWNGAFTGTNPTGAAGGVLSGTYPNPGMAAGAAATNVGSLGGVLGGTLPNPTMHAGAAATNVGSLGGALAGTLPNPTLALPSYTGISYGTNYSDFGGATQVGGYAKDGLGIVHVRGLAMKSAAWALADTIATLPAGFRPSAQEDFSCFGNDHTAGTVVFRVSITTAGVLTIGSSQPTIGVPAVLDFITLAGITFQQGN